MAVNGEPVPFDPGRPINDTAQQEAVDQALDTLILATSHLNAKLVEHGWPPVRLPERHARIEPFFDDLTQLIQRMDRMLDV